MDSDNYENQFSREIPYHRGEIRVPGDRRAGATREEMAEMIRKHWMEIIHEASNIFCSASEVLEFLHKKGFLEHVKKANGVGDLLGAKHLDLPRATGVSPRRYLIPAISWEKDEIEKFLGLSPEEQVQKALDMEKELLGLDPNLGADPEPEEPTAESAADLSDGAGEHEAEVSQDVTSEGEAEDPTELAEAV